MKAKSARLLLLATAVATAAVLLGPRPLTVVGGLLLGFVLPGIALTGLLFRGRRLTAVERSVLAPALSLAVLVTSGLVMFAAGISLQRVSWAAAAAGVTALAGLAQALPARRRGADEATASGATPVPPVGERRVRLTPDGATVRLDTAAGPGDVTTRLAMPPVTSPVSTERPPLPVGRVMRQLVPMVAVLAVLAGAGWMSYTSSRDSYDTTVTALSATPSGPVIAGRRTVDVVATGLVAADAPYTVVVTAAGGTTGARRTITAATGDTWREGLLVPAGRLTVTLYRVGDTAAYRTLFVAAAG